MRVDGRLVSFALRYQQNLTTNITITAKVLVAKPKKELYPFKEKKTNMKLNSILYSVLKAQQIQAAFLSEGGIFI